MFFKSDRKSQDQVHGFSHLGEDLRFEGEIDCKGEIEIAGKVKGNIKAKKLRILETGSVKGLVQAADVEVLGYMVGNIESANIHIGEKGIVRGDLHFENNLTVLEGADISGHVQKNKK
ncbi:MAG: polymer-forming cytoskeletal protein, partial [Proteobacteria bacterium]|nr:polymer-forming cytoskeletal protein [Candidatus Fonsibacter sp. PEL3]